MKPILTIFLLLSCLALKACDTNLVLTLASVTPTNNFIRCVLVWHGNTNTYYDAQLSTDLVNWYDITSYRPGCNGTTSATITLLPWVNTAYFRLREL